MLKPFLCVGEGSLLVSPGATGAVVSGSGGNTVVVTGTINAINALLDGLSGASVRFEPPQGNAAPTSLKLVINDLGNGGAGGMKTGI